MAVYVDDWQEPATVPNGPRVHHTSTWSHLIADSQDELHDFAVRKLGLRRSYFQPGKPRGGKPSTRWHYDVTAKMREKAIRLGAIPVSWRDVPAIIEAREAGRQWQAASAGACRAAGGNLVLMAGQLALFGDQPRPAAPGCTTVVSLKGRRGDPVYADVVYVGRAWDLGGWRLAASPLANPFRIGPDGTRGEVIARYREYLLARPGLLALIPPLRGRRLGCWCTPLACHADVIAELADTLPAAPGPADMILAAVARASARGREAEVITSGRIRIIITGSRDHDGRAEIGGLLDSLHGQVGPLLIVHGHNRGRCGRPGADRIADEWVASRKARGWDVEAERHPAAWDAPCRPECHHPLRPGRCLAAGEYRNHEMGDLGAAGFAGFPLAGSVGTWRMAAYAVSLGIPDLLGITRKRGDVT